MRLAVDIDETLSWTVGYWVEHLQHEFGNPEKLSVQEIVDKYVHTQHVPYWQSPKALEWMRKHREDNDVQKILPLVEGARLDGLPVAMYLTIRSEKIREGTQHWLDKHHFPQLELVMKPNTIPFEEGNTWKARKLVELYPEIDGIIDDSKAVLTALEKEKYQGKIYLFGYETAPKNSLDVLPVKNWLVLRKLLLEEDGEEKA